MATVSLIALFLCAAGPAPDTGWYETYAEARAAAEAQQKPLLVFFHADWCGWCEAMESDVFPDPTVASLLKGFVRARVDTDREPRVAFAFQVRTLPRTLAANVHGEIAGDRTGYLDPEAMAEFLKDVRDRAKDRTGGPTLSEPGSLPVDVPEPEVPSDPAEAIGHPDPKVRATAAEAFAARGPAALPELVAALASDYLGTRIGAWEALQRLESSPPPFDPWAPRDERQRQLDAWRQRLPQPAEPPASPSG